jgi:Protein of unknown function (DUF3592)
MQRLKLLLKIGGWICVIVGIIVLTISFFIYLHTRSFVQSASRAQGTVIRLDENRGGPESYPVFTFRDAKGQAHEIESNTGENPPAYKIGDAVTLLYQSNRPANAEIDSFFNVWGWNIVLGGVGIFHFVLGFGILVVAIKILGNPGPTIHPAVPANKPENVTLEISYPKALLVSTSFMACFVIGVFAMGIPRKDPLLIGFLFVMITGMSFVFAGCLCFMLRCKIGDDGLSSAVPAFYQQVLRWEEIVRVEGFGKPFYVVKSRFFKGQWCLLPRKFLLKRPDSLRKAIEHYAPANNIIRKKFVR